MFNLASGRNFKAIVISFLGLLLTFTDETDMFDGNMAVLVECHNFPLSLVEQKLITTKYFNRFAQTIDSRNFH